MEWHTHHPYKTTTDTVIARTPWSQINNPTGSQMPRLCKALRILASSHQLNLMTYNPIYQRLTQLSPKNLVSNQQTPEKNKSNAANV